MKKKILSAFMLMACLALTASVCFACGDKEDNGEGVDPARVACYFDTDAQTLRYTADDSPAPFTVSFNASAAFATVTDSADTLAGEIKIPAWVRYGKNGKTVYPVREIGYEAFRDNADITQVTLSENTTKVGANAFYGCTALTALQWEEGVQNVTLGSYSFAGAGLTSAVLPAGVLSVGNNAFDGCAQLASVTLPATLTEIGLSAFRGCALTSVTIPASVVMVGNKAFEKCAQLSSVTFSEGIALTEIKESTFLDCVALQSIAVPAGVKTVGLDAFRNCGSLSSVSLPIGLIALRNRAFSGCAAIESLTLPYTLESVGNYLFEGCAALSDIQWGDDAQYFRELIKDAENWNDDGHTVTVTCADRTLTYKGTTLQ